LGAYQGQVYVEDVGEQLAEAVYLLRDPERAVVLSKAAIGSPRAGYALRGMSERRPALMRSAG
jgi:hypothetical protein